MISICLPIHMVLVGAMLLHLLNAFFAVPQVSSQPSLPPQVQSFHLILILKWIQSTHKAQAHFIVSLPSRGILDIRYPNGPFASLQKRDNTCLPTPHPNTKNTVYTNIQCRLPTNKKWNIATQIKFD